LTTIFPNLAYAKLPQLYGRPLLHLWLLKFAQLLFEQRNIDDRRLPFVSLLDTEDPENNSFWVVNQLLVKENNNERRFDVVVFVNKRLSLLFSFTSNWLTTQKLLFSGSSVSKRLTLIPFVLPFLVYSTVNYNALCIIADGIDAKTSSISALFTRFLSWKAPENIENDPRTQLQILTKTIDNDFPEPCVCQTTPTLRSPSFAFVALKVCSTAF
jgi:type I site-specific restriction-modification system R (restriction) subunit